MPIAMVATSLMMVLTRRTCSLPLSNEEEYIWQDLHHLIVCLYFLFTEQFSTWFYYPLAAVCVVVVGSVIIIALRHFLKFRNHPVWGREDQHNSKNLHSVFTKLKSTPEVVVGKVCKISGWGGVRDKDIEQKTSGSFSHIYLQNCELASF